MTVKIYTAIGKNIRIRENIVFTVPELITDAGMYIESAGGYYAGGNIFVDGKEYAIIIAPKELGEYNGSIEWKTSQTITNGANSTYNGKANMTAIESAGLPSHPAAEYCSNLNINGFSDWHLPSPDELEVCYRYLKPTNQDNNGSVYPLHDDKSGTNPNSNPVGIGYTSNNPNQTSNVDFIQGGSQEFEPAYYWTSMEYNYNTSWVQSFYNGLQGHNNKIASYRTRAVRWIEI